MKRKAIEDLELTVNMERDKQELQKSGRCVQFQLKIQVMDSRKCGHIYALGPPISVSRTVSYSDGKIIAPNYFSLPPITMDKLMSSNGFIGDVGSGCDVNVDILNYVPHRLTHLETSAHILRRDSKPGGVLAVPPEHLNGIVYLIDLTSLSASPGESIEWDCLKPKLRKNTLPISMLALKTRASTLPSDHDFGDEFLALAPETAIGIHDYVWTHPLVPFQSTRINCLLLDIPSADRGNQLDAHRSFFGLPENDDRADDSERRALVELAYFVGLEEGYYYGVLTPPQFETNAVATGIYLYPLNEIHQKMNSGM